jgi:hypothetical protein
MMVQFTRYGVRSKKVNPAVAVDPAIVRYIVGHPYGTGIVLYQEGTMLIVTEDFETVLMKLNNADSWGNDGRGIR